MTQSVGWRDLPEVNAPELIQVASGVRDHTLPDGALDHKTNTLRP